MYSFRCRVGSTWQKQRTIKKIACAGRYGDTWGLSQIRMFWRHRSHWLQISVSDVISKLHDVSHHLLDWLLATTIVFFMVTKRSLPFLMQNSSKEMLKFQSRTAPLVIAAMCVVKRSSRGHFGPTAFPTQASTICLCITAESSAWKLMFWALAKECRFRLVLKMADPLKWRSLQISCFVPSAARSRTLNFGACAWSPFDLVWLQLQNSAMSSHAAFRSPFQFAKSLWSGYIIITVLLWRFTHCKWSWPLSRHRLAWFARILSMRQRFHLCHISLQINTNSICKHGSSQCIPVSSAHYKPQTTH